MDKRDVSIIEIIERMIGDGEPDDRIVKTLKELGIPEEKAEKLIRIAQADTFALLRREVRKIVEQQLEQEKPVLKKFIEEEAMSVASETRQQVTKAVISDLKEYEQDLTGQSRTFQEQIKENVSRVNELSDRVRVKLNELGDAVRAIQTGKIGPLSPEDIKTLQMVKSQMGQLNESVKQIQSAKADARQIQPLTEQLNQLQEVKNRMNNVADSLRQIQAKQSAEPIDTVKQLQEMQAKLSELGSAVKRTQLMKQQMQLSAEDLRQLQVIKLQMTQLGEAVRQVQIAKADSKQIQPIAEEIRQMQEARNRINQLAEALKQLQARPAGQTEEQARQIQEMRTRMSQLTETITQMQSKTQIPTIDTKQLQDFKTKIGQLNETIRQMQAAKADSKQIQSLADEIKGTQALKSNMTRLAEALKQLQSSSTTMSSEEARQLQELRAKLGQMNEYIKNLEPYKDQGKTIMDLKAKLYQMDESMKVIQSKQVTARKDIFMSGAAANGDRHKLRSDVLWGVGLLFGLANLYFLYNIFGKPLSIDSLIVMTIMALLTITWLFVATELQPGQEETTFANLKPLPTWPARK